MILRKYLRIQSLAYLLKSGVYYVFEGNIHNTGGTIKWLQDELKLLKDIGETESLAHTFSDN